MPITSRVQPLAEAALHRAASWYQDQEPESLLWLELFDEFEAVLEVLRAHPDGSPVYKGRVRRALLHRFPYAIYYVIEGEEIAVVNFLEMQLERGPTTPR